MLFNHTFLDEQPERASRLFQLSLLDLLPSQHGRTQGRDPRKHAPGTFAIFTVLNMLETCFTKIISYLIF